MYVCLLKISFVAGLFPFDDAKVRRKLLPRNTFSPLLMKNVLIIDENQAICVRTHKIVHENSLKWTFNTQRDSNIHLLKKTVGQKRPKTYVFSP